MLFHFVFTDDPELASAVLARLGAVHAFSSSVVAIRARGFAATPHPPMQLNPQPHR